MDKALAFQEFESTIDGGRLGGRAGLIGGHQVIGLHRLTAFEQEFENAPSRRGKPLSRIPDTTFGGVEFVPGATLWADEDGILTTRA